MDHEEEQAMELEALEAILGEEGLSEYTGMVPSGWDSERRIHKVKLEPEVDDAEVAVAFDLLFQHTAAYPEELPNLKVSNTRGLSNADVNAAMAVLAAAAEDNLGMASVFAVMQAGRDWLEAKAGLEEEVDPAVLKKQADEAAEREREAQRAQGTPVTKESFAAWLAAFTAEHEAAAEAAGQGPVRPDEGEPRGTGKAWFQERYAGEGDDGTEALEQELAALDVEAEGGGGEGGSGVASESGVEEGEEDSDEDFLDDFLAEAEAEGGAGA